MKESENVSEERTSRNRGDMERHFSFGNIYSRAVPEWHMTMPASNNTSAHLSSLFGSVAARAFFAQDIPFTRRSRPLIGLEYYGESEARLFLVPARGRNSIERAEVPRLVVLRLR
jgi:hypothetical protein